MSLSIVLACVACALGAACLVYRQRRRQRAHERQRLRQRDRIKADWNAMLRRQRGEE